MSLLKENMELAKRAIRFVDKFGITSTNVKFRLSSMSRFDHFMLHYMRSESNQDFITARNHAIIEIDQQARRFGQLTRTQQLDILDAKKAKIADAKPIRTKMLQIIHSSMSKSENKKLLQQLMDRVGYESGSKVLNFMVRTQCPDEARIRSCRKAIKFKHGNCGEKSAIAATWLLENTKNMKNIFWVSAANWDHAWALLAGFNLDKIMVQGTNYKDWPDDVVVVDGWTSDWYPIKHPVDPFKGTPANLFQHYVRRKVQKAELNINIMETLSWPPQFPPTFRLESAGKPNTTYKRPPELAKVVELADSPQEMQQEIEDG